MRSATRELHRVMHGSPYLTVVVVAAVVRIVFVVVSFISHQPWLIPDEGQYIELAEAVAEGRGAEAWFPGYGQSLYDTVRVFMVPLAFLFDLLGPSRIIGQLWAASFGVATAVGVTVLGRRLGGPRVALMAGLSVALMPSQVLWSSVVLRESLIWCGLVLIALGVANWYDEGRSDSGALGLVAGGTLALSFLRTHTMLASVWAVVLVVMLIPSHGRVTRLAWSLAIALIVPLAAGLGPGGYELARDAVPNLGTKRTLLSDDAESAFTATTIYEPDAQEASPGSRPDGGTGDEGTEDEGTEDEGTEDEGTEDEGTEDEGTEDEGAEDEKAIVNSDDGTAYVVEESLDANLRAIPRGAIATTLRPYPWEQSTSSALRIASIENLIWYVFYVLALAGAWIGRRQLQLIAFPVVSTGAIFAVAFVSQGNLGTAFRHRGQIFWALALLAALAVDQLLRHRHARRHAAGGHPGKSGAPDVAAPSHRC